MSLELTESVQKLVDGLTESYSEKLIEVYNASGHTYIRVEADALLDIVKFAKEEYHFIFLSDIIGVDRYTSEERFEVLYNILNLRTQDRIFLKVRVPEEEPVLESLFSVYRSANWLEREVYDMFGIRFNNHPDPRRVYMPDDFQYFPLRKEFPLLGIPGSIELPNTTPDTE
ncbi:NADH-quinone oxidoreductase subunit C [Balneola sp. MJW-20]|uniref:NADH-quinone oxidoreductase subunit C n=1 Tax=Gracilimonas aurantiaca TaxID=3234185 RepID=UPI0034668D98